MRHFNSLILIGVVSELVYADSRVCFSPTLPGPAGCAVCEGSELQGGGSGCQRGIGAQQRWFDCYTSVEDCCSNPEVANNVSKADCVKEYERPVPVCNQYVSRNLSKTNADCQAECNRLSTAGGLTSDSPEGKAFQQSCMKEHYSVVNNRAIPDGQCFNNWIHGYSEPENLSGFKIIENLETPALCQAACQDDDECQRFVWSALEMSSAGDKRSRCILKNEKQVQVPATILYENGSINPPEYNSRYCNYGMAHECTTKHYDCAPCEDGKYHCIWKSHKHIAGWKYCPDSDQCLIPAEPTFEPTTGDTTSSKTTVASKPTTSPTETTSPKTRSTVDTTVGTTAASRPSVPSNTTTHAKETATRDKTTSEPATTENGTTQSRTATGRKTTVPSPTTTPVESEESSITATTIASDYSTVRKTFGSSEDARKHTKTVGGKTIDSTEERVSAKSTSAAGKPTATKPSISADTKTISTPISDLGDQSSESVHSTGRNSTKPKSSIYTGDVSASGGIFTMEGTLTEQYTSGSMPSEKTDLDTSAESNTTSGQESISTGISASAESSDSQVDSTNGNATTAAPKTSTKPASESSTAVKPSTAMTKITKPTKTTNLRTTSTTALYTSQLKTKTTREATTTAFDTVTLSKVTKSKTTKSQGTTIKKGTVTKPGSVSSSFNTGSTSGKITTKPNNASSPPSDETSTSMIASTPETINTESREINTRTRGRGTTPEMQVPKSTIMTELTAEMDEASTTRSTIPSTRETTEPSKTPSTTRSVLRTSPETQSPKITFSETDKKGSTVSSTSRTAIKTSTSIGSGPITESEKTDVASSIPITHLDSQALDSTPAPESPSEMSDEANETGAGKPLIAQVLPILYPETFDNQQTIPECEPTTECVVETECATTSAECRPPTKPECDGCDCNEDCEDGPAANAIDVRIHDNRQKIRIAVGNSV